MERQLDTGAVTLRLTINGLSRMSINPFTDFQNPGEISPTLPGSFASAGQYGHSVGQFLEIWTEIVLTHT